MKANILKMISVLCMALFPHLHMAVGFRVLPFFRRVSVANEEPPGCHTSLFFMISEVTVLAVTSSG